MSELDRARDRLIVAYDFPSPGEALEFDRRLEDEIRRVKVGLELYTVAGPEVVRELEDRGRRVFLDLKLHDIPNTVAGGVRAAARHGVDFLTLHAEGGPEMMKAAAAARDEAKSGLRLLAVTVLTSLTGGEYPDVYRSDDVSARVMSFATAAEAAGVDGVVCSPLELESLASVVSPDFLRVTPGIRPAGAATGDQARVATPVSALTAGASHLVVGRPITRAENPLAAARRILEEMASA